MNHLKNIQLTGRNKKIVSFIFLSAKGVNLLQLLFARGAVLHPATFLGSQHPACLFLPPSTCLFIIVCFALLVYFG